MAYSNTDDINTAAEIMRRFSILKQERGPYEAVWDDITEYVVPSRGSYANSKAQDPERKSRKRLDSTATYAHRSLTARVIAEFTNSGTRWFDYRAPSPEIDKEFEVRSFLQNCSDKVYTKLNASSFKLAHTEFTSDWCSYGTACMKREDNGKDGYTYQSISPSEIWVSENKDNEVDCVYREYELTYRQVCESFDPSRIPDDIHKAYCETPHKPLKILHCVEPNSLHNPEKKHNKYFRYKSTFILQQGQVVLGEGSFKRKPYIVARFWKRPTEAYGGSPAFDALPDIRMLNVMKDVYLRAAQLTAAPPFGLAHDSVVSPLRLTPYGVNYGAISADGKMLVQRLLEGNLNLGDLREMITDTVQQIRSAFFVDPLMNRENSIRTAAEVGKRSTEEMTGLAPFLDRFDVEYLSEVLDGELAHLLEYNNDLPIPKLLNNKVPQIEYTGPLAKTQRGQELNNNLQFAQIAQSVGQVDPSLMQNVDWNAWLRNVAQLLGVPMDTLNSPEAMAAMKAAAAQQQQMQQLMEQGPQAVGQIAGAMNDAAKAGLINRQDLGLPATPEGF